MKLSRPTAKYIKENSCIEDIKAIANEFVRANRPATGQDSRKREPSPRRAKR